MRRNSRCVFLNAPSEKKNAKYFCARALWKSGMRFTSNEAQSKRPNWYSRRRVTNFWNDLLNLMTILILIVWAHVRKFFFFLPSGSSFFIGDRSVPIALSPSVFTALFSQRTSCQFLPKVPACCAAPMCINCSHSPKCKLNPMQRTSIANEVGEFLFFFKRVPRWKLRSTVFLCRNGSGGKAEGAFFVCVYFYFVFIFLSSLLF